MNGMELNVNYSILFLYTCGLAYYSLSFSLSLFSLSLFLPPLLSLLPPPSPLLTLPLLASTCVGEIEKLRGKGRLGEK